VIVSTECSANHWIGEGWSLLQSNLADSEGLAVTLYFLLEGGSASLLQPILLSWGGEGSVPGSHLAEGWW